MNAQYIDAKFKDRNPSDTIKIIQHKLEDLGLELEEKFNDSGLDNCCSYRLHVKNAPIISSNGKGITQEFARASAYGELIERTQCGLFFYKFQSIYHDPMMNLQSYAPDKKYMTTEELEANGDWMDPVIQTYGNKLSRKRIAQQCQMYACTNDGQILTVPFLNITNNKIVYLPVGFIEQIYSANGCCAGNTKEEALVHGFSEILERKCDISALINGSGLPRIPDEILFQYSTIKKVIERIRDEGIFDVAVFGFSEDFDLPVVATRIINKKTQGYVVNAAADPVLEIAIQRTLTEIFQGRNIKTFDSVHSGQLLKDITSFPKNHNVLNLLETGNGVYAADFFAEEYSNTRVYTPFTDNSHRTNAELLEIILDLFRTLKKPIYIRNNSFLGFPCYKIIIPGFSESRGFNLTEEIQEYGLTDQAAQVLRRPAAAQTSDLFLLLMFHSKVQTAYSRSNNFGRLSGLPIHGVANKNQLFITLSYAAFKINKLKEAVAYIDKLLKLGSLNETDTHYFRCVRQYLQLKTDAHCDIKIRTILYKFHQAKYVEDLFNLIDNNKSPYEKYLLNCTLSSCGECRIRDSCSYTNCKRIIERIGSIYKESKIVQHSLLD